MIVEIQAEGIVECESRCEPRFIFLQHLEEVFQFRNESLSIESFVDTDDEAFS